MSTCNFALSPGVFEETVYTLASHGIAHSELLQGLKPDLDKIFTRSFTYAELERLALDYGGATGMYQLYSNTAAYFTNCGHHRLAADIYRDLLRRRPDRGLHSLFLQNQLIAEGSTNATLLEEHKEWVRLYSMPVEEFTHEHIVADPERKIRVGYVCHFFDAGVSVGLMVHLLRMHNTERFEIFCYDDGETREEFRQSLPHITWRDTRGMSDERVAKLIYADRIDILQEANGHCIINRFGAVAYRPAPIQINWYNHAATTAMPGIDYFTTDKLSVTDADLPFYTEKAYRQERFFGAVRLEGKFEGISAAPPCEKNGFITFGYLGAPHKITQQTIALWASVLKAVPDAKMMIKGGVLQFRQHRESFMLLFEAAGIDQERMIVEGPSPHDEMVQAFNQVDIMLDTFPVTGGTTIFESLWNGIPPITLRGERWVSRSGASVLANLGVDELIAETPEAYTQKAIALAGDRARIAAYRRDLRPKMATSRLTDMDACVADIELAYDTMWREWCAKKSREPKAPAAAAEPIPESLVIDYTALTPEKFSQAMSTHGGMMIRSLYTREEAAELIDETNDLFFLLEHLMAHGLVGESQAEYIRDGHPSALVPNIQLLQNLLNKSNFVASLQRHFNEEELVVYNESTVVRRCDPNEWKNYVPWHQDIFERTADFLTVWIPLMQAGSDAPGLEFKPRKLHEQLNKEPRKDYSFESAGINEEKLLAHGLGPESFHPVMEVGDVLVFDPYTVHRTYFTSTMTKPRISLDIRINPRSINPQKNEWKTEILHFPVGYQAKKKGEGRASFQFQHLLRQVAHAG